MFLNRLIALLHEVDGSLIEGTAQARLYLYQTFGISPKLHVLVPFVLAWLSTLALTIFSIFAFLAQSPELFVVVGQVIVLGVTGCAIFCLYKHTAPHQWEARDFKQDLAKTARFRDQGDPRIASWVVLTSTSINIVIVKTLGLMTPVNAVVMAMFLVWATGVVMVSYVVSADPPPPESGDMKLLPQGA